MTYNKFTLLWDLFYNQNIIEVIAQFIGPKDSKVMLLEERLLNTIKRSREPGSGERRRLGGEGPTSKVRHSSDCLNSSLYGFHRGGALMRDVRCNAWNGW